MGFVELHLFYGWTLQILAISLDIILYKTIKRSFFYHFWTFWMCVTNLSSICSTVKWCRHWWNCYNTSSRWRKSTKLTKSLLWVLIWASSGFIPSDLLTHCALRGPFSPGVTKRNGDNRYSKALQHPHKNVCVRTHFFIGVGSSNTPPQTKKGRKKGTFSSFWVFF